MSIDEMAYSLAETKFCELTDCKIWTLSDFREAIKAYEAAKQTQQPDNWASTNDRTILTKACIESIIRRHASGWIMDKEMPMSDYLFAKAEEMAVAILAVYPPQTSERESQQPEELPACFDSGTSLDFVNGYNAGLAAVPEREYGWQPIETAPKDGTWVLLAEDNEVFAGHWAEGEWRDYGDIGCNGITEVQPRLWMPLPKLPVQSRRV